jgi:hypothetical protein
MTPIRMQLAHMSAGLIRLPFLTSDARAHYYHANGYIQPPWRNMI